MNTDSVPLSENVNFGRKRRKKQEHSWKRNVIKKRRACGESYTSWSGKNVTERISGPDCKCKKKCFQKISENDRKNLLEKFNAIGEKTAQDIYLQSGIKSTPVKRPKSDSSQPKSASYYYFVRVGINDVSVCRTAYCSIFGEKNPNRIKRLAKLCSQNIVSCEGRGKHHNRPNKHDDDMLKSFDNHIRSFPLHQTHYNAKCFHYLSSEMNVARMHRLYLEKYYPCCYEFVKKGGDQNKICCPPKLYIYRNYFNETFNLPFGRPKSDYCNTCEELKIKQQNASKAGKEKEARDAEIQLKVHKARANAFKGSFKKSVELAKANKNIECLVFDFMQHVPVPHLSVSEVFYLRQMWLFTFCIHRYNTEEDQAYFYSWNECDAKHGVNEVLSCLNHFIFNKINPECDTLYLFSDACTGQNRNHTMVNYMISLVNQSRYKFVHQYFPTRGHSFLQCDIDFAALGKIKKQKERAGLPDDWLQIFQESHNFTLFPNINFFDSSTHFSKFFKKSVVSKGDKFCVTKYKRFVYRKGSGCAQVSETGNSNVWFKFNLLKAGVATEKLVFPQINERVYTKPFSVPLKKEKVENIKTLYKYLTDSEREFYNNVKSRADSKENEEHSGSDFDN